MSARVTHASIAGHALMLWTVLPAIVLLVTLVPIVKQVWLILIPALSSLYLRHNYTA